MMPRWMWFLPLAALVLGTGLLGLRYGLHAVRLTETDVITAYAERHVARFGGALSDCYAENGADHGVWIVVRCAAGPAARGQSYFVNRLGWLARQEAYDAPRAGRAADA